MKHHKNLSQFLDTRKASSDLWSWVHIVPTHPAGLCQHLAINAYGMGKYTTLTPEGLTRPVIVPDGKEFLTCLADNPEHEMRYSEDPRRFLTVTWEKKIPQPPIELANDDGTVTKIKQDPIYEKQEAEFSCYARSDSDPQPESWLGHLIARPVLKNKRHGIRADQLKVLSTLKEGHLKSKDEPANLAITVREGCATFRLPNCDHNFVGAVTLNKMNGEA